MPTTAAARLAARRRPGSAIAAAALGAALCRAAAAFSVSAPAAQQQRRLLPRLAGKRPPTIINQLSTCYKRRDAAGALSLYDGADKPLPAAGYAQLLNLLATTPDSSAAVERVFGDMADEGVPATEQAYTALAAALARDGELQRAQAALAAMSEAGIRPRLRTWWPVAERLAAGGDLDAASALWHTYAPAADTQRTGAEIMSEPDQVGAFFPLRRWGENNTRAHPTPRPPLPPSPRPRAPRSTPPCSRRRPRAARCSGATPTCCASCGTRCRACRRPRCGASLLPPLPTARPRCRW